MSYCATAQLPSAFSPLSLCCKGSRLWGQTPQARSCVLWETSMELGPPGKSRPHAAAQDGAVIVADDSFPRSLTRHRRPRERAPRRHHGLPHRDAAVPTAVPTPSGLPIATEPGHIGHGTARCAPTAAARPAAASTPTPPSAPPLCHPRPWRIWLWLGPDREQLATAHRYFPTGHVGGVPEVPHGDCPGPARAKRQATPRQDAHAGLHRRFVCGCCLRRGNHDQGWDNC